MRIKKGDKDIAIPNWLVLMGILAVDNIASNTMKLINNKIVVKTMDKKIEEEAQ